MWNRFLATAPTIAREVLALLPLTWDSSRYRSITVPTLLLSGELTGSPVYVTHEQLVAAIPHAEAAVLPGQRHIAFATDPGGFCSAVVSFTTR